MIDLTDSGPPSGGNGGSTQYLPEGWHIVKVKSFKETQLGKPAVDYVLEGADGMIRQRFYVTPAAKFRLKGFVEACGYRGELRRFEFNYILGMTVNVKVEKGKPRNDGKRYLEVTDWQSMEQMDASSGDDEDQPF